MAKQGPKKPVQKPTRPTTVEVRSPRKPSQTKLSQRKEEK